MRSKYVEECNHEVDGSLPAIHHSLLRVCARDYGIQTDDHYLEVIRDFDTSDHLVFIGALVQHLLSLSAGEESKRKLVALTDATLSGESRGEG